MGWGVKLLVGALVPAREDASLEPSRHAMEGDHTLWAWTLQQMTSAWGTPERISDEYPFDLTHYYQEISQSLVRRFVSFCGLFPGEDLANWKRASGIMEFCSGSSRRVNIDPGFLDGAKLVLASTKNRAQRVPIAQDLFAEVTLRFRHHQWEPFDYTFPDFRSGRYDAFLHTVRQDWLRDTQDLRRKMHD